MLGGQRKLKEKLIDSTDEQYIFYNTEKKFQQQIEIHAILNRNNAHKVIVIIDKKSTIDYLSIKIAEEMEKFQDYTNLEGLRATDLTKRSDKGLTIKIPSTGEMKDHINDGDVLYCDLDRQECWVKTVIKIKSRFFMMIISLDIKFRLDTLFKIIKLLLLKCGINFWVDYIKEHEDDFHYTFTNVKFKTQKAKINFDVSLDDFGRLAQFENLTVSEIFDIHSEIVCTVDLVSLEELLHEEFKNTKVHKASKNKLRWIEYQDMSFETFLTEKKFEPERLYISKTVKRIVKQPNERTNKMFYLYNKNSKYHSNNEEDYLLNLEETKQTLIVMPQFEKKSNDLSPKDRHNSLMLSATNIIPEDPEHANEDMLQIADEVESDVTPDDVKPRRKINFSSAKQLPGVQNDMIRHHNLSFLEKSKKLEDLYISDSDNTSLDENNKEKDEKLNITKIGSDDSVIKITPRRIINNSSFTKGFSQEEKEFSFHSDIHPDEVAKFDLKRSTTQKNVHESPPRTMKSAKFPKGPYSIRDTSKYSNLCAEFKSNVSDDHFINIIEGHYNMKIAKFILEKVTMPRFRDLKIDHEFDIDTKMSFIDENEQDEPIIVNIKKILMFITFLLAIFIGAILFIFLSK